MSVDDIARRADRAQGYEPRPEYNTLFDREDGRTTIKRAEYGDDEYPGQWIASDLVIDLGECQ